MNSQKQSIVLSALDDANRITKKESFMSSLLASLKDPNQNFLVNYTDDVLMSNYWVPETYSSHCPTGLRELDGLMFINKKQAGSKSSFKNPVIFEYKKGVLSLEHLMDTLYLKDYANCVLNGTNKKARSSNNLLRNLYNKAISYKLQRLQKLDTIYLVFVADRISIQAQDYIDKIEKANKYLVKVNNNQKVPIKIAVRTYKDYIYHIIDNQGIQWNHTKSLNDKIKNISSYKNSSVAFEKWEGNKKLGYWSSNELVSF